MPQNADGIAGVILGTALGDALGLPYEKVSRQRAPRLLGPPDRFRFLFGRGMISDDTEHTCLVAQALSASGNDSKRFSKKLAWRIRWWLLGLPAGLGRATLLSGIKLWLGFSPNRSGVNSAGNGPAMRSAILGAAIADDRQLQEFVRISTRITHTDPMAEYAALAVALAARIAARTQTLQAAPLVTEMRSLLPATPAAAELISLIERAGESAQRGESTLDFALGLGLARGVTGYAYHTVPVSIHAALRYPHDFKAAVQNVILCGGDADTTAAITGGIVGAAVGRTGLPQEWLNQLWEWPRTVRWMARLGEQLANAIGQGKRRRPIRVPILTLLARNLMFTAIVLFHGFRRLAPPY